MMDSLFSELAAILARLALSPVFLLFLTALFVVVMTRNYRRSRFEVAHPELTEGEQVLDEVEVAGPFVTTRTLLTNRRVLQQRVSWLFSARRQLSIAFEDVHSVVSRRHAKRWLFLAALVCIGLLNPLALVLLLWGLEAKSYSILFDTPFAQMPRTRLKVKTSKRWQLSAIDRFYRNAHAIWARVRGEKTLAAPQVHAGQAVDTDFAWGRPVWVYLGLFLLLGTLQRLTQRHLSFDDYLYGPLYLAIPLAVARRSQRDALWTALLGPVALLTVKIPDHRLRWAVRAGWRSAEVLGVRCSARGHSDHDGTFVRGREHVGGRGSGPGRHVALLCSLRRAGRPAEPWSLRQDLPRGSVVDSACPG